MKRDQIEYSPGELLLQTMYSPSHKTLNQTKPEPVNVLIHYSRDNEYCESFEEADAIDVYVSGEGCLEEPIDVTGERTFLIESDSIRYVAEANLYAQQLADRLGCGIEWY
jgi:hypothetical protein